MEAELIIGKTKHDRIDEAVLRESYGRHVGGLPPSSKLMLVERVETLFSTSGKPLARCSECEGWSPEELAMCPYCGLACGAKKEAKPEEKNEPTGALAAMKKAAAPSADSPVAPVVATEKMLNEAIAELEGHVHASRFVDAGKVAQRIHDHLFQQRLENGKPKYKGWQPFVKEEIARSLGVKPSEVDRWMELAKESSADISTLAVREESSADISTLDANGSVRKATRASQAPNGSARIAFVLASLPSGEAGAHEFARLFNAAITEIGASFHDLGSALNAAQDAGLNDRLGMTWEEYVNDYFDLPKRTAHTMQRVARTFTREQVALLGISKAYELTTLPEKERARLLPEAPKMSVRELRDAIVATKETTTSTALVVQKKIDLLDLPKDVVLLRLAKFGEATNVIELGPNSFVATLPGIEGGALQLVCRPGKDGYLEMTVTPIAAS